LRSRRGVEVDIWSEMEEVRRSGYALDLTEEYTPGIWAVAMALEYDGGSSHAVVWVAGFKAALSEKKLARIIKSLRETVNHINTVIKARFEEGCPGISENLSLMSCHNSIPMAAAGADAR